MNDVVTLKPSGLAILNELGTYRFLTAAQLVRIGIGKTTTALYPNLKELVAKPKPLANRLDFGVLPTHGRLAQVYHLTGRGAEVLADSGRAFETVAWPKRVRLFAQDYFHRIQCVDLHVALQRWANGIDATLDPLHTYYAHGTKTSADNFAPKTTVRWPGGRLTADLVFQLNVPGDRPRLCFLELHRGTDLRRIWEQAQTYITAIRHEALELAFDYPFAARVLLIFEEPTAATKFLAKFEKLNLEANTASRFFIASAVDFQLDPFFCWHQAHGEENEELGPLFQSALLLAGE